MKKIIALNLVLLWICLPVLLHSQTSGPSKDQSGLNERVITLEKGHSSLKARTAEAKKKFTEQKILLDSLDQKVKALEKVVVSKTDSFQAKIVRMDTLEKDILGLQGKLNTTRTYLTSCILAFILCFIILLLIIIVFIRRQTILKDKIEDLTKLVDEKLPSIAEGLTNLQNRTATLSDDLQTFKDQHHKNHNILDEKMGGLEKSFRSEISNMQVMINETLNQKITATAKTAEEKIENLAAKFEKIVKQLKPKE